MDEWIVSQKMARGTPKSGTGGEGGSRRHEVGHMGWSGEADAHVFVGSLDIVVAMPAPKHLIAARRHQLTPPLVMLATMLQEP